MTLGPPRRCRCGNLAAKDSSACGLVICIDSNAPQDDSDETEGRALYRAKADALAKAQVSIGKRRVKVSAVASQERNTP